MVGNYGGNDLRPSVGIVSVGISIALYYISLISGLEIEHRMGSSYTGV